MTSLVNLAYFLAYTVAIVGAATPLVYRRNRSIDKVASAGRFLGALAVAGIVLSLQVILDALGITDDLPGSWPDTLTATLNALVLAALVLAALGWSALVRAFSPARFVLDRARRPLGWSLLGIAVVTLAVQTAAILARSDSAVAIATVLLSVTLGLLAIVFCADLVRLYRPVGPARRRELTAVRVVPGVVILVGITFTLIPEPWDRLIAPVALTTLVAIVLSVFFRQARSAADPRESMEMLFDQAALTPREREIAVMLADGLSYKDVTSRLFVSLSTVQTHVSRIYSKLGVGTKTELSNLLAGRR